MLKFKSWVLSPKVNFLDIFNFSPVLLERKYGDKINVGGLVL